MRNVLRNSVVAAVVLISLSGFAQAAPVMPNIDSIQAVNPIEIEDGTTAVDNQKSTQRVQTTSDIKDVKKSAPTSTTLTPNSWDYKALKTLVKHGSITDLHGLTDFGQQSYTREEVVPLIMDAIDHKDKMNDNDKFLVERLESAYDNDIRSAKWDKMHAEEAADEAAQNTKTVSADEQARLDSAAEVSGLERHQMSKKEVDKKMENFTIDDSRVKVNGDVRIRYSGGNNFNSKTDTRTRVEMKVGL